jgi:hypothetical protein
VCLRKKTVAREELYKDVRQSLQTAEQTGESVLTQPPQQQPRDDQDGETFSDIDDEVTRARPDSCDSTHGSLQECLGLVLTASESAKKARIWTEMHKDYLKDQEMKRQREADASKVTEPKKKKRKTYNKQPVSISAEVRPR